MARSEIPADWRKRVCAILKEGVHGKGKPIEWTDGGASRFDQDTFGAWLFEADDAFIAFLSGPKPLGCLVQMGDPPGVTYEFIFPFNGRSFYGKILLRTGEKAVQVFSAHIPRDLTLRCD